jgi:putative ABC transport system ATP-binding protein
MKPLMLILEVRVISTIIEDQDLTKTHMLGSVKVEALCGVNIEVAPANFVVILGTSGSRKTTLLHLLGVLDRPTSGKVIISGTDLPAWRTSKLNSVDALRYE